MFFDNSREGRKPLWPAGRLRVGAVEEMKEPRSLSIGTGKTKRVSDRGGMSVTDYRDEPEDAAASEANR